MDENGYADAKLVETVAKGMQTEIGRKALIAAVDIMIEREEAEVCAAPLRSDGGARIVHKHTNIKGLPETATKSGADTDPRRNRSRRHLRSGDGGRDRNRIPSEPGRG